METTSLATIQRFSPSDDLSTMVRHRRSELTD